MAPRTILAILILFVAGCSRAPSATGPEPSYDSDQAHRTLVQVLDAWKAGKVAGLARHKPPIRFVDDDCTRGARLVSYKVQEADEPVVRFQNVAVELVLREGKGTATKTVAYQISLGPDLAVLRGEY